MNNIFKYETSMNTETMYKDELAPSEIKSGRVRCSCCGREFINIEEANNWYQFSVCHGSSDNKYFDVCSLKCYLKQVGKSVKDLENSEAGLIDEMNVAFAKKLLFFLEEQYQ